MDVDVLPEKDRVIELLAGAEILRSLLHQQCVHALVAADRRIRMVFNRSARNIVSLTVDGSGPTLQPGGTSMKSRRSAFRRQTV